MDAFGRYYESLCDDGEKLLAAGEFSEAFKTFRKAISYRSEEAKAYLGRFLSREQVRSMEELKSLACSPAGKGDLDKALKYSSEAKKAELENILQALEAQQKKDLDAAAKRAWKNVTTGPLIFAVIYLLLVTHSNVLGFIMDFLKSVAGSGNILLLIGVGLLYLLALVVYFIYYFLGPLIYIALASEGENKEPTERQTIGRDGNLETIKEQAPPLPGASKRRLFNRVTGIPLTLLCYYILYLNVWDVIKSAF